MQNVSNWQITIAHKTHVYQPFFQRSTVMRALGRNGREVSSIIYQQNFAVLAQRHFLHPEREKSSTTKKAIFKQIGTIVAIFSAIIRKRPIAHVSLEHTQSPCVELTVRRVHPRSLPPLLLRIPRLHSSPFPTRLPELVLL